MNTNRRHEQNICALESRKPPSPHSYIHTSLENAFAGIAYKCFETNKQIAAVERNKFIRRINNIHPPPPWLGYRVAHMQCMFIIF